MNALRHIKNTVARIPELDRSRAALTPLVRAVRHALCRLEQAPGSLDDVLQVVDAEAEAIGVALAPHFDQWTGDYLAAAAGVARAGGETPRYCEYDRDSGLIKTHGVLAYVDDEGSVTCTGPAGNGARRLYTCFRPGAGQGSRELRYLETTADELLRALQHVPNHRVRYFLANLAKNRAHESLRMVNVHDIEQWRLP